MKVSVFRGVVAAVALVLLLCIGAFFMQSRFDSSSDEGQAPIPGAEEFAQPAAPLPDDLVALRPATAAKGGWEGLLVRELGRQAVLIAARDEMGLRTRDVTLREILPDPTSSRCAGSMRTSSVRQTERCSLASAEPAASSGRSTFVKIPEARTRTALLTSRSRRKPPRTTPSSSDLRVSATNREGRASRWHDRAAAEPSPKVAEQFDLISQYAAARAWHNAIRPYGETAERLAGLVRAYSNLGLLTSHHWSAAQKAFQARSLLYAERLLRLTGETPNALRSRAYARALIGLPMLAVADLEAADDADANETAPDWCAVVSHLCRR